VSVYAVWVPILRSDGEKAVPTALKKMADERVKHYWDGKGQLPETFKRVLQINQAAWDVYLIYPRDAEWKDEPPMPAYWMHQLNLAPERTLNGDTLAAETRKQLQSGEQSKEGK
jgi:hypothetical protein